MALKDKTVTLQSTDLCSILLARPDTQRERYKNMRKQKVTASRLCSAYKIKQQTLLGTYSPSSVISKECGVLVRCPSNKNRIMVLCIFLYCYSYLMTLYKSFKV